MAAGAWLLPPARPAKWLPMALNGNSLAPKPGGDSPLRASGSPARRNAAPMRKPSTIRSVAQNGLHEPASFLACGKQTTGVPAITRTLANRGASAMRTVSVEDAAAMIPDGASLMIGGFMGVGCPDRVIDELVRQGR